jgi:hypothetical protein
MSTDVRLEQLWLRYLSLRGRGERATPEELCADCPELLAPFRARLAADALDATTPPRRATRG